MAEAPAHIWYQQAISDWKASKAVYSDQDAATRCQAISKQQQTVEKAVKGIVAALRDKGLLKLPTLKKHTLKSELMEITSAMARAPKSRQTRELIFHVQNVFHSTRQFQIHEICDLAPSWKKAGGLFSRNTEYPYQQDSVHWKAPADSSAFSKSEHRKYEILANDLVAGTGKIIAAAER